MQNESGLYITLCKCGRSKRNAVLSALRDDNWDVASTLFDPKGDRTEWLCDKFRDRKDLEVAYKHLTEKAGVRQEEADKRAKMLGLEKAYMILQRNLSKAVSR